MQSELNILAREITRERWLAAHLPTERGKRVARANVTGAIVRYCRLADAGRKLAIVWTTQTGGL